MRIALFVNDLATEKADYTTTELARSALRRGHDVWYIEVEGFAYDPDEMVRARARPVPAGDHEDNAALLAALRAEGAPDERITVDDLDVLMLRNDPSDAASEHPWTQDVGVIFGQVAARRGVVVLNHPTGLARARNKLYFQFFPPEVRPTTLITRSREEIERFVDAHDGRAVLKPLQGSGGQGVFVVDEGSRTNLAQIVEALARDGYVIAQEYLPAATEGDLRLFLVDGEPLVVDGKTAAIRRVNQGSDPRSNMRAGGEAQKAEVDERALELARMVRPKLVQDGMFFVGLDVAGDRLMEINVFSPGGLVSASRLEGVDFAAALVERLERKIELLGCYGGTLSNREIAML